MLIVGDAHGVAPQNISAAVGYNCIRCVTAALAIQLDVSLPSKPDAGTTARLNALWAQIRKFEGTLRNLSLAQIRQQLEPTRSRSSTIVKPYAGSAGGASPGASGAPASSAAASGTGSAGAPVAGNGANGSSAGSESQSAPVSSSAPAPQSSSAPGQSASTAPSTSAGSVSPAP